MTRQRTPNEDTVTPAAAGVAARPNPAARVEAAFGAIHATRMAGLSFVNPALRVEAIGFRRWQGRWLGVLVTPWFMNLLLLPDADAAWTPLRVREAFGYVLPAGVFEFIGAHEPALGEYQSCSLFSPMFEFADQDGARATAAAALAALFDPRAQAGAEGPSDAASFGSSPQARPSGAASPAAPAAVSKRDFLRGRWAAAAPDAGGRGDA